MTHNLQGSFRVWIHSHYYLEVDREGYILGTCYEGALGCVVPLKEASSRSRLALKIPRMLADTVRENAFISQVVAAESVIVHRANEEFRAMAGLIPVQAMGRNILRGVRELRNADHDASEQDGCVLLFYFRKDRNPRICSVKFEGERRVAFPPGCDGELEFFTRELWERVKESSCNHDAPEAASYYFEVGRKSSGSSRNDPVVHSPLIATITTSEWPEVWFAALPSIVYNWANGTLQEAVSQSRLVPWSIDQHYELCCRVLRGVDTLHSKRFIHGDLRPANIMTCGPANAPEDYVVGDYGSFSEDFSQLGSPQATGSGHTVVGGLGRHRASVFYAPERRAGVERETADVALILSTLDDVTVKDEYFIYFGWRSCLIDPRTNAPDERLLHTLRADWRRMREMQDGERNQRTGDRLTRGDRLRVREFIFTVLDAEEFVDEGGTVEPGEEVSAAVRRALARRMVVRCDGRFAQVVHERLTVYGEGPGLQDCMVVGLPNYVELRQWSVATDLYGVGALILYTMFMSGLQRVLPVAVDGPAVPREDTMSNAETLLPQMLEILEGLPSFLALWSDLEDFCWNLEHADNADLSGVELKKVVIRPRPNAYPDAGGAQGASSPTGDLNERRTLGEFALRTVNNLLRSVPNIRYVLHKFGCAELMRGGPVKVGSMYNAAHFLLFVHFVMACLHRRSHLRAVGEAELSYPFCRDRCDAPGPNGPAAKALVRLEELKRRLLQPRYDAIVVQDKELVNFDPRDVMQIRIEHAQLGRELAAKQAELTKLKVSLEESQAKIVEFQGELTGEAQRFSESRRSLDVARQTAVRESEQLRRELQAATSAGQSLQQELAGARKDAIQLSEVAEGLRKELGTARDTLANRDGMIKKLRDELTTSLQANETQTTDMQLQRRHIEAMEASLVRVQQERAKVVAGVKTSMSEGLGELKSIGRRAWFVPKDAIQRLQQLLTTWQAWGD